jgi:hypothetical protein
MHNVHTIHDLYLLFKGEEHQQRMDTVAELSGIPRTSVQQFYYRNRIPAHFWQRMLQGCKRAGIYMTIENLYAISYPDGDNSSSSDRRLIAAKRERENPATRS